MTPRLWDRLGPVSGILFVILVVAGIVVSGDIGADPEDPAAEIARELADALDRQEVAFMLFGLSLVFFVVFMAYLRHRFDVATRQGPAQWFVPVFWGGTLLYGAGFLMLGFVQLGQTVLEDYGSDVQVAKTVLVLGWNALILIAPGILLFMGAAAVLVLHSGVLPKWLGWAAVVAAVAAIAPWIPIFVVWILVTSIYLLVRPGARVALEDAA